MRGSSVRQQAIADVKAYVPPTASFTTSERPGEIFGLNVFTKAVMQQRLPKTVYKAVMATIDQSMPLDPDLADAIAIAMKDWRWRRARLTTRTSSTR